MFGAGGGQNPNPFGGGNPFGSSASTGSNENPSVFGTQATFGTSSSMPAGFGSNTSTGSQPSAFGSQSQSKTGSPFPGSSSGTFGGVKSNVFGGAQSTGFGGSNVFGSTTGSRTPTFGTTTTSSSFSVLPGTIGSSGGAASFGGISSSSSGSGSSTSAFGSGQNTPGFITTVTTKSSTGFSTVTGPPLFGSGISRGSFGGQSGTSSFTGEKQQSTSSGTAAGNLFGAVTNTTNSANSGQLFSTGKTTAFGTSTAASAENTSPFSNVQSVPLGTAAVFLPKTSTEASGKQSSSLFGGAEKPTDTTGIFTGKSAASQNVFGPTDSSSIKNPFAARTSSSPQNVDNTLLFGKGPSTTTGSEPVKTPVSAVFGAKPITGQSTNPFGGSHFSGSQGKAESKGLFGKHAEVKPDESKIFGQASDGKPAKTDSGLLFGKKNKPLTETQQPRQQTVGKLESSATSTLFGKPASMTGQTQVSASAPATGLFGKVVPPKETTDAGAKDVNLQIGRRIIRREPQEDAPRKGRATGLFGRAIQGVTANMSKGAGTAPTRNIQKTEDSEESLPVDSLQKTPRRIARQRSTREDISTRVALVAKNIPANINNKVALRKHFSRFGKVSKLFSNPSKASATIHFEDHESALNAKNNGRLVRPGLPLLTLFWSSYTSKSPVASTAAERSPPAETAEKRQALKPTSLKSKFTMRSDLDDELASMAGTQDVDFGPGSEMRVIERPRDIMMQPLAGSVPQKAPPSPKAPTQAAGLISRSRRERDRSVSPVNLPVRKPSPVDVGGIPAKVKAKPREASPAPAESSPTPPVSLHSLVGRKCTTVEEKLEVLEARDKILREASGNAGRKAGDYAKAKVIKGTCMDMCPEKERYLRQARRRLGTYEIIPESDQGRGSMLLVNHARAIKEYSRSSADQDMPLANELRPPEILERTMVYILNNLVDEGGEGKWSEWFEFIWSRSRAIRKDITQQQLCNQTAVSLVERCVRFHIYCSERLCEEDPSIFDMKINDENLTKCLQTLKEMYHDLATKHNQTCPNEAEFRAYMVLMNLNEGDILRETQQLRDEVRASEAVTFALRAYSAVNSHNYIRFFKMVRQATYLNACILHRYFNQMWSKALLNLVMAYSVPGHPVQLAVSELVRLLGFEDEDEAAAFCEHYGLSSADGTVVISRQMFTEPESAFSVCRAPSLIETKLTCTVGEVINGAPLPPNIIEEPTSSFDEDGRYRPDDTLIAEEPVKEPAVEETEPPPAGQAAPAPAPAAPSANEQEVKPRHPYSNDAIKMVAHELFIDVINEMCLGMSERLVQVCRHLLDCAGPAADDLILDHIRQVTREVSKEVIHEQKAEELELQARNRAELSARKERASLAITDDLVEDVIQKMVAQVSEDQQREVKNQLRNESKERCILAVCEELYTTTLKEEVQQFAQEYFKEEVEKRRHQYERSEYLVNQMIMRRHFRKWKNEFAGRQRLKRSMMNFPAAPSMLSSSEQVRSILPESQGVSVSHNAVHLGQRAWLTLAPPNELMRSEEALITEILRQKEEAVTRQEEAWTPLDLGKVTGHNLLNRSQSWSSRTGHKNKAIYQQEVYWKLVVGLPDGSTHRQHFLNEWLTNKLTTSQEHIPPEFYSHKSLVISLSSHSLYNQRHQPAAVNICVRTVRGELSTADVNMLAEERHLQGTSSVLYMLQQPAYGEENVNFSEERERLTGLLDSLPPGSAPVLVIAAPPGLMSRCSSSLSYVCEGRVSNLRVMPLEMNILNPATSKQLCDILVHLAGSSPPPPSLKTEYISDYIEHGIQRFFLAHLNQSATATTNVGLLDQVPSDIVSLYNTAVQHLARVVTSEELGQVSWPPQEFCHNHPALPLANWNEADWLEYVSDTILNLTLPEVEMETSVEDWDTACQNVWQYLAAVVDDTGGSDVFLLSRVRSVLRKVRQEFEDLCYWSTGLEQAEPSAENIPWKRIIEICVDHKMASFNSLHPNSNLDQLFYAEVRVHYKEKDLDDFRPPEDWLDVSRQVQPPETSLLETSIRKAVKRKKDEADESSKVTPPKQVRCMESAARSGTLDLTPVDKKMFVAQELAHTLRSTLARERKAMESYDHYLEGLLRDGELPIEPEFPLQGDLSNLFASPLPCR